MSVYNRVTRFLSEKNRTTEKLYFIGGCGPNGAKRAVLGVRGVRPRKILKLK